MCGISGFIGPRALEVLPELERAQQKLVPRGPDGVGSWSHEGAALAHTRLAIIDLAHGAQPMHTPDGAFSIVYNGEIYNYRELKSELEAEGVSFETESDTEVALQAYRQWGDRCFTRFRGMFALCIYDVEQREAILARDPFGVKPLVYAETPNGVCFASELNALVCFDGVNTAISQSAVNQYFSYGYIPAPETIYEGVRKLEPAHVLRINREGQIANKTCYWRHEFRPDSGPSRAEWLEEIDQAVDTAVQRSLVADVPFGLFLSGGIDSSLVASRMAKKLGRDVEAFCIGFEEEGYDESGGAREVAEHLGIPLEVQILHGREVDHFDAIVAAYGEPFSDSSAVPTWDLCRMARKRFPMVLAGDGGDELFAGYSRYDMWVEDEWTNRRGFGLQMRRGKFGKAVASARRMAEQRRSGKLWRTYIALFPEADRISLLGSPQGQPGEGFQRAHKWNQRFQPLSYVQGMDLQTYLHGDVLTKVDIASMAHGLEVRPPLLDLDLAELAFRIPADVQRNKHAERGLQGKSLLKELLEREVPRTLWDRPKKGFGFSHEHGFMPGQGLHARLTAVIENGSHPAWTYLDSPFVQQLLKRHEQSRMEAHLLWSILVFATWLQARN